MPTLLIFANLITIEDQTRCSIDIADVTNSLLPEPDGDHSERVLKREKFII